MMRLATARRLLVLPLLAAALVASTPGESAVTAQPSMKLVRAKPLTLRGTGFAAGEKVRVVLRVSVTTTKRVTATGRGAFVVAFHGAAYNRCSGLTAFAVGSRGSRARLVRPAPVCPPKP